MQVSLEQRSGRAVASRHLKRLDSLAFGLVFILTIQLAFADVVHGHSKNTYGRVRSVNSDGVTLFAGCSGSNAVTVPLSQLEQIEFSARCAPGGLTSTSSPVTAACNAAHKLMFTVVGKNGANQPFVIYTDAFSMSDSGSVTLRSRSGKTLTGSAASISNVYYSDQCLADLPPDSNWVGAFTAQ